MLGVAVASTAQALTRGKAGAVARRAADRYTDRHFGVSGGAALWRARCTRIAGGWRCRMTFNGSECTGQVLVSNRSGRAYRVRRMGCSE